MVLQDLFIGSYVIYEWFYGFSQNLILIQNMT